MIRKYASLKHSLLIVTLMTALILLAWNLGTNPIERLFPGFALMRPNTAIGLFALSLGCWLMDKKRMLALGLTFFVLLLSTFTLFQYIFSIELGIDELFFKSRLDGHLLLPPGRLAPAAGLSFFIISLAILFDKLTAISKSWIQALLVAAWVLAFQAIVSYFFGYKPYHGLAFYTQMALNTSFSFLIISSVLLLSSSTSGFMSYILKDDTAGRTGRRILIAAILLPTLNSAIKSLGLRFNMFDVEFEGTLSIVLNVICFSWIAFQTSRSLMKAEKESLQNERQLKIITDKLPAFISYMDKSGKFTFANKAYEELLGLDRSDILGKNRSEFSPVETANIARPFEERVLKGERVNYQNMIRKEGQDTLYFEVEHIPDFDEKTGEVKGAITIGQNITALQTALSEAKAAQVNLHNVFLRAKVGICILEGADFVFKFVNETYVNLLFGGDKELLNKTVVEALPEAREQGFIDLLSNVYQTGEPFIGSEFPISLIQADGNTRLFYLNFIYQPKFAANGDIDGVIAFITDVTELVESRKKVENAVQARDQLISICSHELLTPISSMKLTNQILLKKLAKDALAPEVMIKSLTTSEKQIDRLIKLIEEMLDFSRIGTENLKISKNHFSLSDMVYELVERLQPHIDSQGVEAKLKIEKNIAGIWDQFRIEQVLTNLITNALKYGDHKSFQVTLRRHEQNAILEVIDQGLGIPQEAIERIFEPFERISPDNNITGLGMGLYITKTIVEAHGGSIKAESQLGMGSVFRVSLPIHTA